MRTASSSNSVRAGPPSEPARVDPQRAEPHAPYGEGQIEGRPGPDPSDDHRGRLIVEQNGKPVGVGGDDRAPELAERAADVVG